ncbi:hypothetical protein HHI36_012800 [Cryptolaemus montrouzieri]|uniref:Uncharacterized protein n=1 Tax=Cryptolaemus montrouzieri TaxID=559131 RepID=A0ABD2NGG6_9CUCU
MKRRVATVSKKKECSVTNSDIQTQTDYIIMTEDLVRLPVVLLDKSIVNKYILQQNGKQLGAQIDHSYPERITNSNKKMTTNYSAFLKPITNNEYANSTFSERRSTYSPVIRKKTRSRKVKFYRPKPKGRTRRLSVCEEVQEERISLIRDASDCSEALEPIVERSELSQRNLTYQENLGDTNQDAFNNAHSIEVASPNICELPNISIITQMRGIGTDKDISNTLNRQYSTKSTNTNEQEIHKITDFGYDCVKINAHTVNIHNHFYERRDRV